MDYRTALKRIYRFTDYEQKGFAAYAPQFYNLERVQYLLSLLGNPHHQFQSVHIAGTKGKGSTASMIESVLRAAGHRTGLYTSPHLHTFRERIQVSGTMIGEEDVVRLLVNMLPEVTRVDGITAFEVMTGLAFSWFVEQGVEWAVLEVGLGGRLDATNVVMPAVAVITSLSLDHTAVLGDTLAQIAAEKAGIVKPGVPVVSAPQADEAMDVIVDTCQRLDAPLIRVGRDWTWTEDKSGVMDMDGQTFSVHHGLESLTALRIPLLGEHQLENATTAIASVATLQEQGLALPESALRQGLLRVSWPGRLEVLSRSPLVVVDSAHNPESALKLMAALHAHLRYRQLTVILGASSDHVTPELMNTLLAQAHRAIATQTRHPRAAAPEWLRSHAATLGFRMEVSETVPQALESALATAGPEDLILGAGSVFIAAELRAAWFARQGMPVPPTDPA